MQYLDPKNDLTFKKIFGENPDILISFLNALMPFEESRYITQIEYLTPELAPETPFSKNSIVDVRCIDNAGRQFIIEMQMYWTPSFMSRVLFNASKAYVRQLPNGRKYETLQPVYTLSLINDVFRPDIEDYYHYYKIVDIIDTEQTLPGMEFVFIELPKFKPKTGIDKKMTVLWLRFLTEIENDTEHISDDFSIEEPTKKAVEILQISGFSKKELLAYDKYWDNISTERTIMDEQKRLAEEKGWKEGQEAGREAGREEGREEGMKKGREEGRQESLIYVARNLLEKHISIDEIMDITHLSRKQIEELEG